MEIVGENNTIRIDGSVQSSGFVLGSNNVVIVDPCEKPSRVTIHINGNDNFVHVVAPAFLDDPIIKIGNRSHPPTNNCVVRIGRHAQFEPSCRFLLDGHGDKLEIGEDALFANSVTIRCSDLPHLIFDDATGEYLSAPGVVIGDHVWIGERATLLKRTRIASGSIVGTFAVVAKPFDTPNVAIAGNPARVIREGVRWFFAPDFLPDGSQFQASYAAHVQQKTHPVVAAAETSAA